MKTERINNSLGGVVDVLIKIGFFLVESYNLRTSTQYYLLSITQVN
ncbi:hypothetical protein BA1DRAFT_03067 [Photorhabdus aegyptia]|uniref:Uncharacterized protein n=1 Tax=Photorhabdus aegyptia TaxID=2805098 RepID=A0A022PFA6_9GAMM|nr:hypothetical protein BA1DRAFT_03067 [Photorhabdus aegyptia]